MIEVHARPLPDRRKTSIPYKRELRGEVLHFLRTPRGMLLTHPGDNQWGQLGLEDQDDRGDEPNEMGDNLPLVDLGDGADVVSVACGDWHT